MQLDTQSSSNTPNATDVFWLDGVTAGIDEVGIGPLAGPVVAAAVILDFDNPIEGLADSKRLTDKRRRVLVQQIREQAICCAVGWANVTEIDEINILRASHLAMQRACEQLTIKPESAFVDGNKVPELGMPCQAVIRGDGLVPQISAASILAKVARDDYMVALHEEFPGYGFDAHKGYPTRRHVEALNSLGVTEHHRMSFAPVRNAVRSTGTYIRQSQQ